MSTPAWQSAHRGDSNTGDHAKSPGGEQVPGSPQPPPRTPHQLTELSVVSSPPSPVTPVDVLGPMQPMRALGPLLVSLQHKQPGSMNFICLAQQSKLPRTDSPAFRTGLPGLTVSSASYILQSSFTASPARFFSWSTFTRRHSLPLSCLENNTAILQPHVPTVYKCSDCTTAAAPKEGDPAAPHPGGRVRCLEIVSTLRTGEGRPDN